MCRRGCKFRASRFSSKLRAEAISVCATQKSSCRSGRLRVPIAMGDSTNDGYGLQKYFSRRNRDFHHGLLGDELKGDLFGKLVDEKEDAPQWVFWSTKAGRSIGKR
jgi:hypothetical protein